MKKILIATDGSPSSTEAVALGVELATEADAEVIFVHVAPESDVVPSMGLPMVGSVAHRMNVDDRASLEKAGVYAARHGIPAHTQLLAGDPVDEIAAYADTIDADLVVVGSRGHGTISSALLGSVSRGILSESKRPVLEVRGVAAREVASV